MNLDKLRKNDPTGMLKKENHVSKHYPEEYQYILQWCNDNNLNELLFKFKVYHCLNDLKQVPTCECGNTLNAKQKQALYHTFCSTKCANASEKTLQKRKDTNLERFGTEVPQRLDILKNKHKQTCLDRYGVDSHSKTDDFKNKFKQTMIERYGVDHPGKVKEFQDKRVETNRINMPNIINNRKNTLLQKYGSEEGISEHYRNHYNNHVLSSRRNNLYKVVEKKCETINYKLLSMDWDNKTTTCQCDKGHIFSVLNTQFNLRYRSEVLPCIECYPLNYSSYGESTLREFVENNYQGEIICNHRKLLQDRKEVDIFLPELNIAIEYNGLYWHNEENKGKTYHYDKSKECLDNNVKLIHIWEDEWKNNRTNVEKYLLSFLQPNNVLDYNIEIKTISKSELLLFIEQYGIDFSTKCDIIYGVFVDNILTSVSLFEDNLMVRYMTNNYNTEYFDYIINYFKTLFNQQYINVVFDFCKLLNVLNYSIIDITQPDYYLIIKNIRHNSHYLNKQKAIKLYNDPNLEDLSYEDLLELLGIYKTYNSGRITLQF